MSRQPAVADRFYPANAKTLERMISQLLPTSSARPRKKAIAAISPHAGYIYSGGVAAETLAAIEIPKTVIILGLNHHGQGAPVALSLTDWEMPMGRVTVNRRVGEMLLSAGSPITHDEVAHRFEHSVEVQIPFLQRFQSELTIVPIVLSQISYPLCEEVAATIAGAVTALGEPVLLVASSDMTHYESREAATQKDREVLKRIEQLNPRGVYDIVHSRRISMCGVIPVTVAMIAAKSLGAQTAQIVKYTDSGVVSGDTDQVVGYAGVIIS